MRLAHQQMKFWRALSNLNQPRRRLFLQRRVLGLVCRSSPQWFERADCIRPAIVEEVAKPQQITSLVGIGRLLHDRLKRPDRTREIVLTEICETNIQPDSRNVRRQLLSLVQHFES